MALVYVPNWTRLLLGGLVPSVVDKDELKEILKDFPDVYVPGVSDKRPGAPDPGPDPGPDPDPFDGLLAFNTDEDTITAAFTAATGEPVDTVANWVSHYTWAANKWNEFLFWNTDVIAELRQEAKEGPDWAGMVPKGIAFANEKPGKPGVVASCGPRDVWAGSGVKFFPAKLQLNIFTKWVGEITAEDWRLVMFHEMGHAIGIGILWDPDLADDGAVPPVNNLLNGEAYKFTLAAFNKLQIADGRNMTDNMQVPLHEPGNGHWDDTSRLVGSFNYGGFPNEVMGPQFSTGDPLIISELTVESPRDFGWERRTDEGAGSTQTPEIRVMPEQRSKLRRLINHCDCGRFKREWIAGKLDEA